MSLARQFLTLKIGEAVYGIEVHKVREVVSYKKPSPMPNASPCMLGVINLRGNAVPVLDLRAKFGLEPTTVSVDTCIIILELEVKEKKVLIGITADMVHQVAEFAEADMETPPNVSENDDIDWIEAMARHEEGFVIILDIDRTLAQEAIVGADRITAAAVDTAASEGE